MKTLVTLQAPPTIFAYITLPEGAPLPAIGDRVQYPSRGITWSFTAAARELHIGALSPSGERITHVIITTDSQPPEGWAP